jgi:flagellar assembly protein FliH
VLDAESRKEEISKVARDEGLADGQKKGYDEGYAEGKQEADRLIERLHGMMDAIFQKRDDILMETENQIVALTLMMTEKVVKTMAESDAAVVRENIIAALEKIRTKSEVILRVNTLDLKLATEHVDDFVKAVENVTGVKVVEDSTVDQGGCIVETDFGAIDARISSQLMELEQKIRELSPVRARRK